jgi:hypothetical protein
LDPTLDLPDILVAEAWHTVGPPPRGSGWWGKGAPLKVQQNFSPRDICDGAGLCSPGRWHPDKRRLPDLGGLAGGLVGSMFLDGDAWEQIMMRMMAGKLKEDPFTPTQIEKGRGFLTDWCRARGYNPSLGKKDIKQEPKLRLLQAFLRICQDPDAEAIDCYCEGVRLGHRMRMPRTPAVYEKKDSWRIKYVDPSTIAKSWAPNYKTARERQEVIEAKVNEDLAAGRMIKMSYAEAKAKYGEDLLLGALGLVEEALDKFRLIHDATHKVLINNRIRARDMLPSPIVYDIAAEMASIEAQGVPHLAIVWDFKSAHRLIQVDPRDWGLQACTMSDLRDEPPKADDDILLNTVGTFGFSTAGYWWGRLAGMLIRGAHYLLGWELRSWILLFADDGKMIMPASSFRRIIPAIFAFFGVLSIPIKWPKVTGGVQFQWIGYWNDLDTFKVGISQRRQAWVLDWITTVLQGGKPIADFDSALGRLSFVCGAIVFDRPFLAPLFSLAAVTRKKTGGKVDVTRLPPYVKFILAFLAQRLGERRMVHCLRGKPKVDHVVERFRTDAKAEGDLVTVGGYQTRNGKDEEIHPAQSKWFLLKLTRANAPWAFARGEPFRAIASLELLGSLLGIMLLLDGQEEGDHHHSGSLSVSGVTDNSGNRFAVARMMTTKWPLVAFLAELSTQLEHRNLMFEMCWVPREQNAEADAITNGDVGWLRSSNRLATSMEELPFLVLTELLKKGAGFYGQLETVNLAAAADKVHPVDNKKKDVRKLSVRDPWN